MEILSVSLDDQLTDETDSFNTALHKNIAPLNTTLRNNRFKHISPSCKILMCRGHSTIELNQTTKGRQKTGRSFIKKNSELDF